MATVADRVLLSAKPANMAACIELAVMHGLGIELMAFSNPDLLDGNWQSAVELARKRLRPIPGMIAMHGPFMDMSPGSPDRQISHVASDRYRQAIRIAGMLGVEVLVFHANFIAAIHSEQYRHSWHQNNVEFWGSIVGEAQAQGVTLAVENMWEFDPDIIGDVLRAVDHPALRACLDVGHAAL
jgi:sugar phosphate isomerase/epimerase